MTATVNLFGQGYAVQREAVLARLTSTKSGSHLAVELADRFGISSSRVRDILVELEREGLAERFKVAGTKVDHWKST